MTTMKQRLQHIARAQKRVPEPHARLAVAVYQGSQVTESFLMLCRLGSRFRFIGDKDASSLQVISLLLVDASLGIAAIFIANWVSNDAAMSRMRESNLVVLDRSGLLRNRKGPWFLVE